MPYLDRVVNHLHEVAGARWTAVQVAARSRVVWRRRVRRTTGRKRRKHRIESLDDIAVATDHQAVSAFQPPHAAARAHVDVANAVRGQPCVACDIVLKQRVAAVDHGVVRAEQRDDLVEQAVHGRNRNHRADDTRRRETADEIGE